MLDGHTIPVDPQLVNIDCTGLGGHDLGGFKDYDICIRTERTTCLPGGSWGSKAMHEFLVLHYMATDSAEARDTFLDLCLPQCT